MPMGARVREADVLLSHWLSLMAALAILGVLVAVGWYVIPKLRDDALQNDRREEDWLANFRELRERGELSEAEFRTIRTTLAGQYRTRLKDSEETG